MIQEYATHTTLNPALWQDHVLRPGLSKKFLKIAKYFHEFLEIDAPIVDVILIGSNANYNWSEHSDIDLHVVIDFMQVDKNLHLVKNYMLAKKTIWNNNYPLTYQGINIELYAQDVNDELHHTVGIYSVARNKWIAKPTAKTVTIDDSIIDRKVLPIRYQIDNLDRNSKTIRQQIQQITMQLRRMRQTGLDTEGEYSVENLAFKKLRNLGYIDRLREMLKSATIQTLQMESSHHDVAAMLADHCCGNPMDDLGWQTVMKHTGGIETATGQWTNPGQCTMIPSNRLTMRNVTYPLIGIDDTGHYQLMKPGVDSYTFPGTRVFEIPLTAQHKTLAIQLMNLIQQRQHHAK